jgi:hypothetical protein
MVENIQNVNYHQLTAPGRRKTILDKKPMGKWQGADSLNFHRGTPRHALASYAQWVGHP